MIYFDNAATTRTKPECVVRAVCQAMTTMGNSGRGAHEATLDASRLVYCARIRLAELFGVKDPSRIAFTSNSTESLNLAIKGLLTAGDHVISTVMEHNSVLRPLYEMEERGVRVSFLPCVENGVLDDDRIESLIQPETRAIITTHASNLTGNLVDIERIGAIARKHGLIYIVDASQTAGVFPIDVESMNIDILCFTGHKSLMGPQGTGGIYVKPGIRLTPLKSGGSGIDTYNRKHPIEMPTALEAGTLNVHGIAGLLAAVEYINEKGMDQIREKEKTLMRRFYQGVKEIPGIRLYGDFSTDERCPIVALNLDDYDSGIVSNELEERFGIAVRSGGHCAPLMHKTLGTSVQGIVRFSFSCFNTEEEIDRGIQALRLLMGESEEQ